jgi:Ca2+/Na+ antiporter
VLPRNRSNVRGTSDLGRTLALTFRNQLRHQLSKIWVSQKASQHLVFQARSNHGGCRCRRVQCRCLHLHPLPARIRRGQVHRPHRDCRASHRHIANHHWSCYCWSRVGRGRSKRLYRSLYSSTHPLWQLIVVVASLARGRPSLAIGNIIGSAISNILGAFSLGLLFHDKNEPVRFDRSSRIYSLVLLVVTTFTTVITYYPGRITWLICGSILIASFAVYIASVGWAISRGTLIAPEDSDSDDSDDDTDDGSSATGSDDETTPLFDTHDSTTRLNGRKRHFLTYHISYLVFGFLAICLSGYILAHAATTIIDEFHFSDVLFGVGILSIATTLPEKFIAVMSGQRGHAGVLVANTAGSNIFLLTLCLGIVMLNTKGDFEQGNVNLVELLILWASIVSFTATIWFGERMYRWIGFAMLVAYAGFIVAEFTVIHGVAGST